MSYSKNISKNRIWELDLVRSFAIIGMIIFHIYYVLDYEGIKSYNLFQGTWNTFGDTIRNTFFSIVGVSLALSWQRQASKEKPIKNYYVRQLKRAFFLLLIGFAITLISMSVTPDKIIRFGVLSFIGTGIIIVLPIIRSPVLLFFFGWSVLVLEGVFGDTVSHQSLLSYILGFYPQYVPSIDYFPIIPWVSSIAFGGFLGHIFFKNGERNYPFLSKPPTFFIFLNWVGRNALWIYILHLPLIVFLIWGWGHLNSSV